MRSGVVQGCREARAQTVRSRQANANASSTGGDIEGVGVEFDLTAALSVDGTTPAVGACGEDTIDTVIY